MDMVQNQLLSWQYNDKTVRKNSILFERPRRKPCNADYYQTRIFTPPKTVPFAQNYFVQKPSQVINLGLPQCFKILLHSLSMHEHNKHNVPWRFDQVSLLLMFRHLRSSKQSCFKSSLPFNTVPHCARASLRQRAITSKNQQDGPSDQFTTWQIFNHYVPHTTAKSFVYKKLFGRQKTPPTNLPRNPPKVPCYIAQTNTYRWQFGMKCWQPTWTLDIVLRTQKYMAKGFISRAFEVLRNFGLCIFNDIKPNCF